MERRMGSGKFRMKNVELRITTRKLCHPDPECSGEGAAKLVNCADSSLSLRMTLTNFEFLIREAL